MTNSLTDDGIDSLEVDLQRYDQGARSAFASPIEDIRRLLATITILRASLGEADETYEAPDGRTFSGVCGFNHYTFAKEIERLSNERNMFETERNHLLTRAEKAEASLGEAEKRADHNDAGWNTALEVAAKWSAKATDANGTADALVSVVQGWRERAEKAEATISASSRREAVLREAAQKHLRALEIFYTDATWPNADVTIAARNDLEAALSTTPATRTLGTPDDDVGMAERVAENVKNYAIAKLVEKRGLRTPGTVEVCNLCNGRDFAEGRCNYSTEARRKFPRHCPAITRPAAAGEGT